MSKNQMDADLVYQKNDLQIVVRKVADPAAITLLKHTVYGTNGIRYQHTGQEDKLGQLHNPFFFHLLRNQDLIGIYCLDERKIILPNEGVVRGFYGRYLSIAENEQGQGYGHLLKVEAVHYIEKQSGPPVVFYSYIEEKNLRSLRISRAEGFRSVATLKTFVFRRFSPRKDFRFSRLIASNQDSLLKKLSHFYTNYAFKTFARINYQTNYFVLKEGDELIAGVQANPVCWKFLAMPAFSGWAMMTILPLSPVTRRFFNPANYQFLALEGIYYKAGREDEFSVLLESVLAHFGYHSALLQIDTKDPLNALLTDAKKMGPSSGFQKNINTHIMVKTGPEQPIIIEQDNPIYVSSFDFT
jgi:RimJ/RimL family protein N-acetyltransferase